MGNWRKPAVDYWTPNRFLQLVDDNTSSSSVERPPSQRIADELRSAINNGDLAPGEKLPSERQLASQHDTARNTARQAIAILQSEGLVEAQHGRGVFVREQEPLIRLAHDRYARDRREGEDGPFAAEVKSFGGSPRVEVIAIEAVDPPGAIVERLESWDVATVLRRRNRYFVDDRPVQLVDTYIPFGVADGTRLDQPNPGPGGIYEELKRAGFEIMTSDETVTARMPTPAEVEVLSLRAGVPVLEVWHTSRTGEGRPFEVTHFRLAADRNLLSYRLSDTR